MLEDRSNDMSRDFYANAETMVYVRFRPNPDGTTPDSINGNRLELGLTDDPIQMKFLMNHKDIHVDDYGPTVPAEVLWMLSEAELTMTLVHFDFQVLAQCINDSMGYSQAVPGTDEGSMVGAGWPLGAGMEYPFIGSQPNFVNSYIRVSFSTALTTSRPRRPWRFFSCYLAKEPIEFPLGSERSLVKLVWRAIPYSAPVDGDVSSKDAKLFDHEDDI